VSLQFRVYVIAMTMGDVYGSDWPGVPVTADTSLLPDPRTLWLAVDQGAPPTAFLVLCSCNA
jgi:hypothetical protein